MTWDQADTGAPTPSVQRWDETPGRSKGGETPGGMATPGQSTRMWDSTPSHVSSGAVTPGHATPGVGGTPSARKNRWDETPKTERETPGRSMGWAETPKVDRGDESERIPGGTSKRKSRWDLTPAAATPGNQTPGSATPVFTPGGTPSSFTPKSGMTTPGTMGTPSLFTPSGVTPIGAKAMGMPTPSPGQLMSMTPEQLQAWRWEREIDERNRPLADEELDTMFPEGYKVLAPPTGYIPIRTPARKITATPTPMSGASGFHIQVEDKSMKGGYINIHVN